MSWKDIVKNVDELNEGIKFIEGLIKTTQNENLGLFLETEIVEALRNVIKDLET